jgi:prepilin-type N-terminal cleavage/methylation domain-containing protein
MTMLAWHLRRLRLEERGMTLAELIVAMSILSIVSTVFVGVLVSVQRDVVRTTEWQQNNDQARVALETIDRQIRSGGLLYPPTNDGSVLVVYTQASAPHFETASWNGSRCVEWRVNGTTLESRWWRSQYSGDWSGVVGAPNTTGWREVAIGVVNYSAPNNEQLFVIDSDPLKGGRTVNVVLLMNVAYDVRPNETVKIQAALTARNTSVGLSTACV